MENNRTRSTLNIMQKTLDYVDSRLADHAIRVTYMAYNMLLKRGEYVGVQLRDMLHLTMLHDIGAYKTEEINEMATFETKNIWEHSIYGYLFLKYLSPLKEMAPVIYYHHADCNKLTGVDSITKELAQVISICDRFDIYLQTHGNDMTRFYKYLDARRDIQYYAETIDLFLSAGLTGEMLDNIDKDEGFYNAMYGIPFTAMESDKYINMLVLSIEFRSIQTAVHTVSCKCVAEEISRLTGQSDAETEKISTAAMLHDIGKVGIPINILEYPGKLNDADMEIMRSHVVLSEKIISGKISDEIKNIAVRHHEKLNGSGYPNGLTANNLSFNERILAVADIFSALCGARSYKEEYSKDRIIAILQRMAAEGQIDSTIVSVVTDNCDYILNRHYEETTPVYKTCRKIKQGYEYELNKILKKTKMFEI